MKPKKTENMGEIKSVKVDNWGVFFLQKLQNFFNKTDYCDLTLQFNDNSQLKVHRLVLNACTDYFNVLEQTCEMIDDVLIMPNELQADLVVPIVNFMYTGTLEFELKIYGKLLKTARDMNMTVLLKLLEAHRRTMETKTKNLKSSPKATNIVPVKSTTPTNQNQKQTTQKTPGRPALGNSESIYKTLQIKSIGSTNFKTGTLLTKQPTKTVPVKGPTRFEYEGSDAMNSFDSTFDNISYESKPLKVEYDEQFSQNEASPFEQLRQTGYNNNKRPAPSVLESPPAKKPNIQDVKEYAEQQRMRKQIAEDYGDEPDFDSILDDEFHNNDDDEEYMNIQESTRPTTSKQTLTKQTAQKQQTNARKSNDASSQQKPTIVVKECSSSNVDHAKIISEVLRKYPHLIKNNKNIKLKIMPTTSGSGTQKVVIKKEPDEQYTAVSSKSGSVSPKKSVQTVSTSIVKSEVLSPPIKSTSTQKSPAAAPAPTQPRRIDSKTMKQLIALGAENTTGPWLCLKCGVNGRPISIPSYRGFRRHLVNTHKEKIDPRLCEHCGWRSINQKELAFHMYTQHDIRTSISFPKCEHCGNVVFDLQALDQHIDDVHPEVKEDNQQCIYCNKTFSTELMLYNHMKDQHKERARDDGVIDFSEEDEAYEEYEQKIQGIESKSGSKIQILSDIDLPQCISLTQISKSGRSTEFNAENLVEILGGNSQIMQPTDLITSAVITSPVSTEPKFINADGNVMELTPAQRAEIMSQLEQGGDGVVMVLDESFSEKVSTKEDECDEMSSQDMQEPSEHESEHNMIGMSNLSTSTADHTEEQVMEEAVHEEIEQKKTIEQDMGQDLEDELNAWKPVDTDRNKNNDNEKVETSESLDEQLEKLTQMTEPLNEEKKGKSKDELDERLKILTNDWTDDEEEENEESSQADNEIDDTKLDEGLKETAAKTETTNETKKEIDVQNILENDEDFQEKLIEEKDEVKGKKVEDKIETTSKELTPSKELQNELCFKDLQNTEEALNNPDSGPSDDEEVMREQPICSTEEEALLDDDNSKVEKSVEEKESKLETANEKKATEEGIDKLNESVEEEDFNEEIKEENQSKDTDIEEESKDLNVSLENEENAEEKDTKIDKPETEEKRSEITPLTSVEATEKEDIHKSSDDKISPDIKKEEIKSLLNEWDDENEEEDNDL